MADDPAGSTRPRSPADLVTQTMGASPFSIDDPRYANWISIGLLVAEEEARIQAELLHRAATVTPERRSALIIEGVVRHFDLRACILSLVKNYDDAMLCLQWLNAAAPEIARRLREQARGTQLTSETFFQLDLRLKQRLRYWTAEALRGAREGEKRRSEPARLAAVEGAAVALERPRPVEDDVRAEERQEHGAAPTKPTSVPPTDSQPVLDPAVIGVGIVEVAQGGESQTPLATSDDALVAGAVDNATRVDQYLREVRKHTSQKFSRRDLWTGAGYTNQTEFERWQRNDRRTSHTARQKFERILKDRPHLKKTRV